VGRRFELYSKLLSVVLMKEMAMKRQEKGHDLRAED